LFDHLRAWTKRPELSLFQPDRLLTQTPDRLHVVTDKKHGPAGMRKSIYLAKTLSLKRHVAYGKHFIDYQNLGLEVCCDSKSQPHVHTTRVTLDRRVQELFDFCKRHDLIELPHDFGFAHA